MHVDPDFQSLSIEQRKTALNCLYAMSKHGKVNRASGVAQIHLIHAIGTTLLGVESSMDVQQFQSAWLHPNYKKQSLRLFLSARKSCFFDAQRFGSAAGHGCSFRCLWVCRLCNYRSYSCSATCGVDLDGFKSNQSNARLNCHEWHRMIYWISNGFLGRSAHVIDVWFSDCAMSGSRQSAR